MATTATAAFSSVVGVGSETRKVSPFYHLQPSVAFPAKPSSFKSLKLKQSARLTRRRLEHRPFVVRCEASSNGRVKVLNFLSFFNCTLNCYRTLWMLLQLTQQEFTEMAWQSIVSSPDVAKENKQQIVETEHLMKALLEQKNGLARRIFSKIGVDNTKVLEATEKFIQRQPKVIIIIKKCYFFFFKFG